ncbi:hypothetical protein C0J52_19561 [Blattella germanica]|nr:hypothetical protein C0J52_19561 [Blattella germanica]
MRGKHGNYHRPLPDETKNAVMDHIRSFKGRESHYSLKKSSKLYLSEELNIKKMHEMYVTKGYPKVSYEYYRTIFTDNFNIGFGYPRSDTCSTCDEYKSEIKIEEKKLTEHAVGSERWLEVDKKIKELNVTNKLHKKKAEVFYCRKKEARTRAQRTKNTESVAIDFQKNLPLPNI